MAAGRDTAAVKTGPGRIYLAPVGTTEPASLTAVPDAAFIDVGYTEEGLSFSPTADFEDLEVAEEIEPIDTIQTSRAATVSFTLAQDTAYNLAFALNADTATAVTVNSTDVTVEPPAAGVFRYMMILWEDGSTVAANKRRLLVRKALQTGASELAHRKNADYTKIATEWRVLKPSGSASFKRFYHPTLKGSA